MNVKVYYNNRSDIEEDSLKKLINDLLNASKKSHFNLKKDKKDIEFLEMKLKRAKNNLQNIILTERDFEFFFYITIKSSEEVQGLVINELIPGENIKLAKLKCVKTLEKLKDMAKEIIDKNLCIEVKNIWLCKQIYECNNVGDLYATLCNWYNSSSTISKKQAVDILDHYCSYIKNSKFLSDEKLDKYSRLKKLFKNILKLINNREEIDFILIENILKIDIPIDVNIKKTLSKEIIDKYNENIRKSKSLQQEKINELLLQREEKNNQLEETVFEEASVKLTEEDMVCLELYLEIVTNLANGTIKIEDFENKTANYLSYVQGTHYKEILEKLIIKIQNSTDINKATKVKSIKSINALKKTI